MIPPTAIDPDTPLTTAIDLDEPQVLCLEVATREPVELRLLRAGRTLARSQHGVGTTLLELLRPLPAGRTSIVISARASTVVELHRRASVAESRRLADQRDAEERAALATPPERPQETRSPARHPGGALPDWRDYLPAQKASRWTFEEAAESFLAAAERKRSPSLRAFRHSLGVTWAEMLGGMKVEEVDHRVLAACIEALQARGLAPKTVRKHVSFLSSALEHAVSAGDVARNPVRDLPPRAMPSNRPRDATRAEAEVLEPDQLRAVLDCPDIADDLRQLLTLLALTGLRFGEAAALRWSDIGEKTPLREAVIARAWACRDRVFRAPKSGRTRRVPIRADLWERLQRVDDCELVAPFRPAKGDPRLWSETTALVRWHRALEAAGIPHPPGSKRRLHALRHSFVSNNLRAGADALALRRVTHDEVGKSAFEGYAHLDWPALCRAASAFEL